MDRDLAEDLHLVRLDGERRSDQADRDLRLPLGVADGTLVAFLGSDDPLTELQNSMVGVLT